jgi:hypothetical protein
MAKTHPKTRQRKYERILTISTSTHDPRDRDTHRSQEFPGEERSGIYRFVPYIRLKGLWLERAGFYRNYRVRVQVSRGKLVITNW